MINNFFNLTATIKRQVYVNNKSSYAVVGQFTCNIQPLGEEMSKINEIQTGRGFALFCGQEEQVQETDLVVVGENEYSVKGITEYKMKGISYKKVLLIKGLK